MRFRYVLLAIAAILLPLGLLLDPKSSFYLDYIDHVWILSHYASAFAAHLQFPDVIHTRQIVGLTHPIFYGHWFYAVGGLVGSAIGPDLAIRSIVLAIMAGQFYAVFRLFVVFSRSTGFAFVMALLVTWSIYPLTNLYNRGAVVEFVALGLLNMSACSLLSSLAPGTRPARSLAILRSALFFTLAAAAHPITGVLGGLMLSLMFFAIVACQSNWRPLVWTALGGAALSALVLSPWLYALLQFARDLPVNQMGDLIRSPFDTFLQRLAPFPFDIRSLYDGNNLPAPYLDAQINVALAALLVALWAGFSRARLFEGIAQTPRPLFDRSLTSSRLNRALGIGSAVALVYLFTISIGVAPQLVPKLIGRVQFAYRLVAYQNVCLFLLALMATQHFSGRPYRRDVIVAGFAFAIAVSFSGLLLKIVHGTTVRGVGGGPWRTTTQRLTLPDAFYYAGDYNILRHANPETDDEHRTLVTFAPSSGRDFAAIALVELQVDVDSMVRSNVYVFPWNRILVDSADVPQLYYKDKGAYLAAFRLPAGRHTIEYRFVPDAMWRVLRGISFDVLLLWCLAGLAAPLVRWWRS